MFYLSRIPEEEFRRIVQLPSSAEKTAIRARLCGIVGVSEDAADDVVAPLLYAKTEMIVRNVREASGFSVTDTLEAAGFSPTDRLYIFESQHSGLIGIFLGQGTLWFENLLDWISSSEDVVMISEDFVSIAILTHYHQLRFGDLTVPGFRDPEWVQFAADSPKRAATNKKIKEMLAQRARKR